MADPYYNRPLPAYSSYEAVPQPVHSSNPSPYPNQQWNTTYSGADPYASNPSFYASTAELLQQQPNYAAQSPRRIRKPKRHCVDYVTVVLLLLVWLSLTLSCIILLYFSKEQTTTGNHIARVLAASSIPILASTILNEVLFERCWRRVVCGALNPRGRYLSDDDMAFRLRAANFGWLSFLKRLFKCKLSGEDIRSFVSYTLLRWGTALAIASVQFCVSWNASADQPYEKQEIIMFDVDRRRFWIFVPAVLHTTTIIAGLLMWHIYPWQLFSSYFDDYKLLQRYQPYLDRTQSHNHDGHPAGSIVSHDRIAQLLLKSSGKHIRFEEEHCPGMQVMAKLKGISFGLIMMVIPLASTYVYLRWGTHVLLKYHYLRFFFHAAFLASNILYLQALDFVIWNISLEGLVRSNHRTTPNRDLRHLGSSSGLMLLGKALKQRKPIRALAFIWLFWIQACLMRVLTTVWIFCVALFEHSTVKDQAAFYDHDFWLGVVLLNAIIVYPLFFLWLFMPFRAPVCSQDGWRWAHIARTALAGEGFYGVMNKRAMWHLDAEQFSERQTLL